MRAHKLAALGIVLAGLSCTVPDKFFSDAGGGDDIDADSGVTLTITISGNSNGTITSDPAGIDCGTECEVTVPAGTVLTLSGTPDANTEFAGWNGGGCSGTGTCQVTVDADMTVDAAFNLVKHTLTITSSGNGDGTVVSNPAGINCGATCTFDFDHGTSITLTGTGDASSSFLGWTGGSCTGAAPCTFDLTADLTLDAAFGLNNTIVVTKDGTGDGTVTANMGALNCGADCDETYAPGTVVTLTAAVIGDGVFERWGGDGTCSGSTPTCVVTVNSAILVTATFTQNQYPLTVDRNGTGVGVVTSDPAGIDCGGAGDCTENIDSGDMVTLTATPTTGKFGQWTGGGCTGSTDPTCIVTVTDATNVTATFTRITVSDVTSSTTNGSYGPGSGISIQVTFSDPVTVDTTGGTPTLALNTVAAATASYTGGSGTNTLTFAYLVAAGQASADLDYSSTSALALNGGTIRGAAGGNATLTFATPGAAGSLGFNKNLLIDGVAPTVSSVSSTTAAGAYNLGDPISIQVVFSEIVNVTGGPPTLTLNSGGTATYSTGSGGTTLTFTYTVGASQNAADLDYSTTTALTLNGGTIRDAVNNNATLTLPTPGAANSLAANEAIVVDTTAPTVSSVSSTTPAGFYNAPDGISIQVNFNESVTVTGGTPTLTLETGASDAVVNYASGSPGSALTFTYTVASGHNSGDLDYVATTSLANGGATITDAAGNTATLTLPTPGGTNSLANNEALVVDTAAPVVNTVSSTTAAGSYNAPDAISIQVNFNESVVVTGGPPTLTLETGATDAVVNYSSGSPGTTINFSYTVAAGHTSADLDYVATSSLATGGGTITDLAGNAAVLTLPTPGAGGSLAANEALVIDTTAPTVSTVSSTTAAGSYNASDAISIQVNFTESVTVTGTPTLTLETGATDAVVNYASGSPGTVLTFTYTVAAGQNSADLDYVATSSLALGAATIVDGAGNGATVTLPTPGTASSLAGQEALVIDTTAPTVSSVSSSTTAGSYNASDVLSIQVNFSESITLSGVGTPTLTLETGTTDAVVNYTSGSPGTVWTFNYTVANGHNSVDLNYVATTSLSNGGATIADTAGNAAVLTLPATTSGSSLAGQEALTVDTTAPTVSSVSSTNAPGGYYSTPSPGDLVSIQVNFSEAVTVTGTPTLTLETGTTNAVVSYDSGSGGSALTFEYTVASGHTATDLDYVSTASLSTTGTIIDAAGNAATRTLPTPGAANSLSANEAIKINPTALVCTSQTNASTCSNGPTTNLINVSFTTGSQCDTWCQDNMPDSTMTSGCWIFTSSNTCYCRDGVLDTGGTTAGGSCL